MAFKPVKAQPTPEPNPLFVSVPDIDPNENLYQDVPETHKKTELPKLFSKIPTIIIPKLNIQLLQKADLISIATGFVGFILAYIGITLAGSYYGPATGQFHGIFATIFYEYQIGTIILFTGLYFLYSSAGTFIRYVFKA